MLLLAWTAAFAVIIAAAIIFALIALRVAIVCFTTGRTRQIWDVIFAIVGLAVLALVFWS